MSTSCAEFRIALEAALAGPEGRRAALAQDAHVAACAGCRAELAREQRLERALAAVPAVVVPPALARRVLARLAPERDAAGGELDELLARVPPPTVPAGLAGAVLAGLAPERARARRGPSGRLGPAWLLAAAAGLVLGWLLLARRAAPAEIRHELARAALALEADEELLAYALEHWELLHDEDLDLWLASLDPVDELLMEVAGEEPWLDAAAEGGAER
ncbi:MAG TPA: hypothetical protein VF530_04590 [Planctomycetota bacterium]